MHNVEQMSEVKSEANEGRSVSGPSSVSKVRTARVPVVCDGVKGVIAFRGDRWVVDNSAELSVLQGLGGSSDGAGRLSALVAALNSGVAKLGDLANLNRALRSIAECEPPCLAHVPVDLRPAAMVACAHWDCLEAAEWLCWALASRLNSNLTDTSLAAGYMNWELEGKDRAVDEYWLNASWCSMVGESFWETLSSHENLLIRYIGEVSDPLTSKERLWKLWKYRADYYETYELQDLVALHPNASVDHIMDIAKKSRYIDSAVVYRVLQNKTTKSRKLREMFTMDLDIGHLCLLSLHPNTPKDVLELLLANDNDQVAGLAAHHPEVSSRALVRAFDHPSAKRRTLLVQSGKLPKGNLEMVVGDRNRHVRAAVAGDPRLNRKLLKQLAIDKTATVRRWAATNPSMSLKLLYRLACDEHSWVRRAVASRKDANPQLVALLEKDSDDAVRVWVAQNPSAPKYTLRQLAADKTDWVRLSVAENASTPVEVLMQLAADKTDWVRLSVAENASTPVEVLMQLAADKTDWVRLSVAENASTPVEVLMQLSADQSDWVRVAVAENPSTPARAFDQLVFDREDQVRWRLAKNPSLPARLLIQLGKDQRYFIRMDVARNPSTPVEALEQLAYDRVPAVREAVAHHPSTPADLLEHLRVQGYARIPRPDQAMASPA